MPCFNRRQAYQSHSGAKLTWHYLDVCSNEKDAIKSFGISIPCGSCIGCRVDYGEMWAFRMHCERQMHALNCFITLTYDDEHLPAHSNTKLCLISFPLGNFVFEPPRFASLTYVFS